MLRLFEQHEIRKTKELNGMWDFVREDNGKAYRLPVPGCWEQHPDMLTYRGQGTYRTKVKVDRDTCLRLEFKGVSHTARVFFDGKQVAEHYNAFTPFSAVIPGGGAASTPAENQSSSRFSEEVKGSPREIPSPEIFIATGLETIRSGRTLR